MRWGINWRGVGVVVFVAFAVRMAIFLHLNGFDVESLTAFRLEPDSVGYDRIAVNLWQYGAFSQDSAPPFTHDTVRTPVYPALLAAVYAVVGHYPAIAIVVQILVVSLASGLTVMLARELGLSSAVAVGVGLVMALDPLSALMANVILTDTLFVTWCLAGLWALARWSRTRLWTWLIVSTVVIAMAALIRPVGQYLPIALLLPIVVMARTLRPSIPWKQTAVACLVVLAISAGILGSWAFRNYQERGVFTISTISTINLLYWRAADVVAMADDISMDEARERLEAQIDREVSARGLSFSEQVALEQSLAVDVLLEHPALAARQAVRGVAVMMLGPGQVPACVMLSPNPESAACHNVGLWTMLGFASFASRITIAWSMLMLVLIYLGAAFGVVALVRNGQWAALALLLTVTIYFIAISAGADAYSRMRIPLFPLVVILAGFGLQAIAPRVGGDFLLKRVSSPQPVDTNSG